MAKSIREWLEEQGPKMEVDLAPIANNPYPVEERILINWIALGGEKFLVMYQDGTSKEINCKANSQEHLDKMIAKAHKNAKDKKMWLLITTGALGCGGNEERFDYR